MISDKKLNQLSEKYASFQKESQEAGKDPQARALMQKAQEQLKQLVVLKNMIDAVIYSMNRIGDEGLNQDPAGASAVFSDLNRRLQELNSTPLDNYKRNVPAAMQTINQLIKHLQGG